VTAVRKSITQQSRPSN